MSARARDTAGVAASRDTGLTPTDPEDVARPGRRSEVASDAKITSRIERPGSDPTPPPLPPSPAAADAARWLERANTQLTPVTLAAPATTAIARPAAGPPPWLFPVLLAVTMLVVGVVIGALLFGHRGKSCPTDQGAHGATSPTSANRAAASTAL